MFDVAAFHYLVKPFSDEKFEEVLQRAIMQIGQSGKGQPERAQEERFLLIRAGGIHIKVLIDDIIYAEVLNRKITLHLMEDAVEYYGRMSDLEQIAGQDFYRVHRAYLVNMKYVKSYDANEIRLTGGTVMMANPAGKQAGGGSVCGFAQSAARGAAARNQNGESRHRCHRFRICKTFQREGYKVDCLILDKRVRKRYSK